MAEMKAKTKQDIENMTPQDRVWDTLSYGYGKQLEQSNSDFAKAISQQDRQMMARGMQRSSYNASTLANMRNQQIKAANDIGSQQIADYGNRLYQIERDKVADEQWQKAFNQQQLTTDQQLAAGYVSAIIAQGGVPSDGLLMRAGLSREDANAMTAQVRGGGGGGGGRSSAPASDNTSGNTTGNAFSNLVNSLYGGGNTSGNDNNVMVKSIASQNKSGVASRSLTTTGTSSTGNKFNIAVKTIGNNVSASQARQNKTNK